MDEEQAVKEQALREQALREQRQAVAEKIKVQMVMCNYGLPDNVDRCMPWLNGMNLAEAQKSLKAVHELVVRLNLFVATGKPSKGSIDFPEARRSIIYEFNAKRPENSVVRFKALGR